MNSPSPLVPQGSLLEQKNTGRSRVKLAFFCVVGVHVAALMVALLSQGCRRESPPSQSETSPLPTNDVTSLLPVDTNQAPANVASNAAPVTELATVPPPPTSAQEYVIQKGDSFYTIARKFNVSQKAVQEANPGVDPLKLQVGKKIVIPPPAPAGSVALPHGVTAPLVPESGDQPYVVKSGDTLGKIAKDHGTTVKAIQAANNLSDTRIKVGQKLKLPAKSVAPLGPVTVAEHT